MTVVVRKIEPLVMVVTPSMIFIFAIRGEKLNTACIRKLNYIKGIM